LFRDFLDSSSPEPESRSLRRGCKHRKAQFEKRGVAALSRRFTGPRLLTANEDECCTPTKVAFGERRDKESLNGLVFVACRLLLLLSPCHGVLARETRRRDVM
jgi:hypothetical protein